MMRRLRGSQMENTTYIALSRLDAQQRTMDVIANNIANANTDGFKAQRVLFSDYLSQQHGVNAPSGGAVLHYTQDRATYLDRKDGSLTQTGNPLDMALSGPGFFTVSTSTGPRLTRSGKFGLMPDGHVADASGNLLLDKNGSPLQLSPSDTNIRISGNGTISTDNGTVGQVGVVTVDDPNQLVPEGGTLYRATAGTTSAAQPKVTQGMVETSNVQPINELTHMIQTQRDFGFVSQFVESENQRQQSAIDKIVQQQA